MHEDNNCIRYLMKEMDPSEELLMERAMMEDEDLLIEVESMRQTLKKLDKLPQMNPPAHIQDVVMQKASQHAQEIRTKKKVSTPEILKYAVAATLALTFTAGGTWLFLGTGSSGLENEPTQIQTAETINAGSSGETTSGSADLHLSGTNYNVFQTSTFSNSSMRAGDSEKSLKVEPWVDRNDVIRYDDQSTHSAQFESLLEKATQKLKPIEGNLGGQPQLNSYQLTGSGN